MPLAAAGIVAAGTIGGALIGSNAASKASDAQMQMQQKSLNFQQGIIGQQTTNAQPYMDFGKSAAGTLSDIYGFGGAPGGGAPGSSSAGINGGINWDKYVSTPDYKFAFSEAQRAQDMSMASKNLLTSGASLRDAQQLGAGYAGQQFGSTVQRLLAMIGVGSGSANALNSSIGQVAGGVANTYNAAGSTAAQGIVGAANPFVNALNTGPGNALAAYKMGGGSFNGSTPTSASSYLPNGPMNINPMGQGGGTDLFNMGGSAGAVY